MSHIYESLERHFERRSSRTITALLAYILTATSKDYFTNLGESLGLLETSRPPWLRTGPQFKSCRRRGVGDTLPLDDDEFDQASLSSTSEDVVEQEDLPTFIPHDLAEALPAARKSLRILQTVDPGHYLCSNSDVEMCQWIWTSVEVERIWNSQDQCHQEDIVDNSPDTNILTEMPVHPLRQYQPELAQFQLFDLEPGTHLNKDKASPYLSSTGPSLPGFLASFSDCLPTLTPKLQHLATVVLQPLFTRTSVLSRALLKVFLASLQFEMHLILLRSYMLFTFPPFRSRLIDALFSHTVAFEPLGSGIRTQTAARLGLQDSRGVADRAANMGQAIGLGHGLVKRDTWPPGGSDLSFFLRTVIVDSLEERKVMIDNTVSDNIWREGEFRLGFALRDLPIGDGKARWLNPMCMYCVFLTLTV